MDLELFAGRDLAVATNHGKEAVIGPALCNALQLRGFETITGLDTDRFGSFSGEVERSLSASDAALAKAREGARLSQMDLVVASEGSFGPYPPAPFLSCDEEHLVLFDTRSGTVYTHRHVSLSTMHGGVECKSLQAADAFAKQMGFPDHALVIKLFEHQGRELPVIKGIRDPQVLHHHAEAVLRQHSSFWLETDLRAMMNPTRMTVIGEAALAFAEELRTCCPVCRTCWFRITGTHAGLPCEGCGWPTRSIRSYVRGCRSCGHEDHVPRPDGKLVETPGACDHCNP